MSGIDLFELLGTDASELAKTQRKKLAEAVNNHLVRIGRLIIDGEYDELDRLIEHSPAGDCMGTDVDYIHFGDICPCDDIGEVIDKLKKLDGVKK